MARWSSIKKNPPPDRHFAAFPPMISCAILDPLAALLVLSAVAAAAFVLILFDTIGAVMRTVAAIACVVLVAAACVLAVVCTYNGTCAADTLGCDTTPAHCEPILSLPFEERRDNACRVLVDDLTLFVGSGQREWNTRAVHDGSSVRGPACGIWWLGANGTLLLDDHVIRRIGGIEVPIDHLLCGNRVDTVALRCYTRDYGFPVFQYLRSM